jgi:hypothetical protein
MTSLTPPAAGSRATTALAKRALWVGTGVAAIFLWLGAARRLPPGDALVPCAVRALIGMPCPGCGMTRALLALGRGEIGVALALHPLSPLVAAEAAALWILWGLVASGRMQAPGRRAVNVFLAANATLLIAVWALRWWRGTLPW